MTIREIRPSEADTVTELYLDYCRAHSERDAEWGMPDPGPIHRWIVRTTETDEAVCLVPEVDGVIAGFVIASVSGHPAMPGVLGTLEELYVRPGPNEEELRHGLVQAAIAWARKREASPIVATVALGAPWTNEELAFWTSLGFENDTTEAKLYFPNDEGC